MAKLPRHLTLLALLAGTALATTPAIVSAQSSTDAVDQSQNIDLSDDSGNSEELLLKKQNNANSGEQTQMPDAEQQDQAVTDEAQDPAAENQDQATEEELLKQKNQSEDQAQSTSQDDQTEDQATDENVRKQKNQSEDQAQSPSDDANKDQTADRERRKDKNAAEDTATDTSSKKKTDETASDSETKIDKNKDQAASEKPSNETTGSINISAEQKTVIKNTIVETNVKPVDVDFKVSIGINVPKTIELHRLPPKVVEIVPAYREYLYFIVADGMIVIVDPGSYEVVYIISV
jgi:hypothetical protein